jgi:hypothetical protein
MVHKKGDTMEKENKNNNSRTLFSVPLNGCLMVIILSALAGIFINECKRSQIRLENDKRKYQNDTITTLKHIANNTFIFNNARTR